ncbi:PaaI family thioesterase [Nocardioides sp. JQ2195]|uniref:PaaI family thioesterase n=1 Tax=Nocardioides sp. JQ2195 TaxID=2592334 RepID=UPI00143EA819|nr:PaaI family thioesterase [Nocardioides sp. JQ2195]QIX25626.1 PaaI family thioesterase [Nocardioides sp. JQ2195]
MTDQTTQQPEVVPGETRRLEVLTAKPNNEGVDSAVAAARRVIEALLHAGDRTSAEMGAIASQLTAVADHLVEQAGTVDERLVDMWAGEGVTRHDPITGPENAIAPPLSLEGRDDGSIGGAVTLGLPYQGPPGHVHGGVSSLLLDHVLGVANAWAGDSGMTKVLTLTYHRPTPLFRELEITGRQTRVEGRKIWTTGEITVDGELCVSAEGLFINAQVARPR